MTCASRVALLALGAVLGWLGPVPTAGWAFEMSRYGRIGFSPDGELFAFEQYGTFDGLGAPYASRTVIDVATDRFVAGSPYRARRLDGDADLDAPVWVVRAEAEIAMRRALPDTDWQVGTLLAFSPVTDLSRDGTTLTVGRTWTPDPVRGTLTYRLEELPFPDGTNGCPDHAGPIVGFRLTADGGHGERLLNDDATLPRSRGCPIGYRIAGVEMDERGRSFAVLLQMFTVGFEGRDGRWLAVTHDGTLGGD